MSDGLNDLLYQERATNRELEATCLLLRNQVLHLEGEVKRAASLREACEGFDDEDVQNLGRLFDGGSGERVAEVITRIRSALSASPPPPDHVVDANKKVGTFEEGGADMQARVEAWPCADATVKEGE